MNVRNRNLGGMTLWLAIGAAGCGGSEAICVGEDGQAVACEASSATEVGDNAEPVDLAPLSERLAALDVDLAVGSQGPQVRAVHDYLTQYGYFRNDAIRARAPLWRPFVDAVPADPETFDEVTSRAVSWFQRSSGLLTTGVVDEPTRAMLSAPRCGMPDGLFAAEPSEAVIEKFKHSTQLLTDLDLTWKVAGIADLDSDNFRSAACIPAGCDGSDVREALELAFDGAFETWERQVGVGFRKVAGGATADIVISVTAPPAGDDYAMRAKFPNDPKPYTIFINPNKNWFIDEEVAVPSPGDWLDTGSGALHEIGHILGLNHSSVSGPATTPGVDGNGATMRGVLRFGVGDHSLHADDDIAGSTKYQTFIKMPTVDISGLSVNATDIAVGNKNAWVVSDRPVASGGFTIHSINIAQGLSGAALTWSNHATGNQGARRIAAGQANQPWIINGSGQVMERTGTTWSLRGTASDCAYDIGVGGGGPSGTGAVWILGCAVNAAGNRHGRSSRRIPAREWMEASWCPETGSGP